MRQASPEPTYLMRGSPETTHQMRGSPDTTRVSPQRMRELMHTGESSDQFRQPPRPSSTKRAVPQARRPPRERSALPYSDKIGARLQYRAKVSMSKLNALGDLTSDESEALYAAFHRHDVHGEVDKTSFVLLWAELKESEPPLVQQRPPPTAAHSLLSSAAFEAIYALLRARGRLGISLVEEHLESSSIFLPMNLGTVDAFVDAFPETFQVSERLVGGRPGHRLVCLTENAATGKAPAPPPPPDAKALSAQGAPSVVAPRLSLEDLCAFASYGKRIELFERCCLRQSALATPGSLTPGGQDRLDVNEMALALLIARDEYYLRTALRACTPSFAVRDMRRSRAYEGLAQSNGVLAVVRVFRELDADFNLALSPDEWVRAVALLYEFGMALEPPHKILPNLERKAVLSLFRQADLTKDGALDINEWLVLLLLLAPSMLSLITAHAATPAGAPLIDWLKLRLGRTGSGLEDDDATSQTRDEMLRSLKDAARPKGKATPGQPSMWRPGMEDPEVARLVRRCMELGTNQPSLS